MNAAARRARKTPELALYEKALNAALEDGFCPYDPDNPDAPDSACKETERRLGLAPGFIANALLKDKIVQNCSLYDESDPHRELFMSMRRAGIEIGGDDRARQTVRRLTDENHRLAKIIKETDREQLTLEEVRGKVFNLPLLRPDIPNWVVAPRLKAGSPGTPITLWSDWHYGEIVEPEAMSGRNAYTMDIADKRIEHLVDRITDICLCHQINPEYPGLIVCLGGDMFSGDGLHEELTDTNEAKTIGLFMRLQGRLIWAIERLADQFGKIYVPCDFGNHARNTLKSRYKLRAETNYEFLLYNQLEYHFRNNPKYADKVSFNISRGAGVHFTVGSDKRAGLPGHRYFLMHGDLMGVKGGDGIIGAIGPIKRGRMKIGESEESIGHDFDTLLLGHWHQYIPIQGIIVNGTLKGWCDYARYALRAPYSPPTQALWFNHPVHGPVTHHKIVLEDGFKRSKNGHGDPVFPPGEPKPKKRPQPKVLGRNPLSDVAPL